MQTETQDAGFGIPGMDDILAGGLERERVYLLEGAPGTGKTTAAMRFLLEGVRAGETGLYITLSETEEELRGTAKSHGWSLEGVSIFELVPPESLLDEQQQQSLLYSSDLELGETTRMIFEAVESATPRRVVIDSLSEIRLLAQSSLRYRRQVLALKHYFAKHGATVLLLDDLTTDVNDKTVHSVAHGVIQLQELAPEYGAERRRVRIIKYRGRRFRGGYHDFTIKTGGLEVYPRIVASEHHTAFSRSPISSGVVELDALLGGGLERGSSALILGPAGTGKSLFAINFAVAAVQRGEKAALFIFDEELGLLYDRMLNLGIDLFLILHIHELLQFLNRQGASTFLTVAQHGLVGEMKAPVDVTYLADTVILLRYFEAAGNVRRAVSVIKKRSGVHENTIREFSIGAGGLSLGEPLSQFQGVLRGVPNFVGPGSGLLGDPGA
ncbi:MAG: circadian clock protein KaiC [Brevundimonas sp.]|nr:MAG: circadian clock protein KaiC [Brevundimonas sp.]